MMSGDRKLQTGSRKEGANGLSRPRTPASGLHPERNFA